MSKSELYGINFRWDDWTVEYCGESDPKIPNQHCQRELGHDGAHQSFSRSWMTPQPGAAEEERGV